MMRRLLLCLTVCFVAMPVYAGTVDDVQKELFDGDGIQGSGIQIKPIYRACGGDNDCSAVMCMCRWRPANKISEKHVSEVCAQAKFECVWPPPPAQAPLPRCISQLCEIPVDGKYY